MQRRKELNSSLESAPAFTPNLLLYCFAVLVVFGIIGATMIVSVSKLKKDIIVEVLKEDIN